MPELPEVETVRRGLQPVMEGARIVSRRDAAAGSALSVSGAISPSGWRARRIVSLGRRAKYLTAASRGRAAADLPSRHVRLVPDREPATAHRRPASSITSGRRTPRTTMSSSTSPQPRRDESRGSCSTIPGVSASCCLPTMRLDEHPMLAGSRRRADRQRARRRRCLAISFAATKTPLKAALLDQRLIAGLGNIYVSRGAVARRPVAAPRGRHDRGRPGQAARRGPSGSPTAIRSVIADAIEAGGSSLRDYVQADGSLGYFQHSFSVYDREGEPCRKPGCGGTSRASSRRADRHSIARSASAKLEPDATSEEDRRWPMKRSSSKRAARSA